MRLAKLLSVAALVLCAERLSAAPRIVVTELPARDAWRVSWELEPGALGISFVRGREPFRGASWSIVEPAGAAWSVVDGRDAIVTGGGARRVVVELASDFRLRTKDYTIHVAFTDGSRLLYTGHLAATPIVPCSSCPEGYRAREFSEDDAAWQFRTDARRTIRLLDKAGSGSLDWTPRPGREHDDGTYVYFGAIEPVAAEGMTLLVDPGMPRWLVDGIRHDFPKMFDYFARLTGTKLDFVPLVLLSYQPTDRSGLTFSGGTLEGLAQIAADGKAWGAKTPEAERLWFRHLAHEAFHFWDGQMFRADRESEWLSEAAAEYASYLALRDAGIVDDAWIERELVEQSNDCLVAARGMSIAEGPANGNFDIVYSCGLVTQLLAGRAIERKTPGRGIGDLYRRLFDSGGERQYGAVGFLRLVDELADRRSTAAIATLVNEGVDEGFDLFLAEALRSAGLAVTLGSAREASMTSMTARDELRSLLKACACASGDETLCANPDVVVCVDGWSVRSEPARAVDALADAAQRGSSVTLGIGKGAAPRELGCPRVDRPHRALLVLDGESR